MMSESYFSVQQINTYIKNIFEAEVMLQNICVYGEISSFNISNGVAYFNLKDESGILPCVLFGANNFEKPNIGDNVLIRGSMNYWSKGGRLSFNAISILPYGKGLLYEKFLHLKDKLGSLGYFDADRKKKIPERVKRIGVVSSPTGAVIRDIIDVTSRRNDTIDIVLFPVKVQGVGADKEIASGIDFFSNYEGVDVVIVARGGGSMEDLEPFNSEIVANATYNCKKPIVSAVGHETDFTIIDFVSDLRAPTPSAGAELVVWRKDLEIENINKYLLFMEKSLSKKLEIISKDIDINYSMLDNISSNKILNIKNLINNNVDKLFKFEYTIEKSIQNLEKIEIKLENNNPVKLSKMGYSKILQNGKVINKISKINDDFATISMIDGEINCKIIRWFMDFEKSIKELQSICEKMEDENLPLNDGVEMYEKGIEIAKNCYAELNKIKGKVTVIKQDLENFREKLLD